MDLTCQSFSTGKKDSDNHDAWLPRLEEDILHRRDAGSFRCAIADGDINTTLGGFWAGQLVDAFGISNGDSIGDEELAEARRLWHEHATGLTVSESTEKRIKEGTGAGFLGVVFKKDGWTATAIGDCCLFQLREGKIIATFPSKSVADLDNKDVLWSVVRDDQAKLAVESGKWEKDDVFLLGTRAMSTWIFQHKDATKTEVMLHRLDEIRKQEDFTQMVRHERQGSEVAKLTDADTTLVRVEFKIVEQKIAPQEEPVDAAPAQSEPQVIVEEEVIRRDFSPEDLEGKQRAASQTDLAAKSLRTRQVKADAALDKFKAVGWVLFLGALAGMYFMLAKMYWPEGLPF